MAKFIVGTKSDLVGQALKDAGVITEELSNIRRIVIDLEVGCPAKIYVELFADNEKLAAGLTGGIEVAVDPDATPFDQPEIEEIP